MTRVLGIGQVGPRHGDVPVGDPYIDAGVLRLLRGQPDRCDLRPGEHHLRYGTVVGARDVPRTVEVPVLGTCGDHVPRHPRLILTHVCQRITTVDISHRVQPRVVGHRQMVIGAQRAARLESHRLQTEIPRRGRASRRHQDLVDDELACAVTVEPDGGGAAVDASVAGVGGAGPVDRLDRRPEPDVDAAGSQRVSDPL